MESFGKHIGKKVLAVMGAVGAVAKDKKNDFHGYRYVSDDAIVTALREAMIKHSLVVLPSQKSCVMTEQKNQRGETIYLTTLEVVYTMIDADSGESVVATCYGYGKDKEDKGVYKAATGAEKYFLLKTFLIPTGDDPEKDENGQSKSTTRPAAARPVTAPQAKTGTPPPAKPSAEPAKSEATGPTPVFDDVIIPVEVRSHINAKNGNPYWTIIDVAGVIFYTGDKQMSADASMAVAEKQKIQVKHQDLRFNGEMVPYLSECKRMPKELPDKSKPAKVG